MVTARFMWKGVGKDVAAMCRDCQQCQRGEVHKQPAAPLHAILVPARRFSQVHVDLVGPLPASSDGHVYLLTIIDRSTRWVEAVLTTAYRPQSNGMVERVHRQIKDALRARGAGPGWHSHLPWVLMGLRAAPKENSAVS
jgi:hypothetical protein